MKYKNRKTGAVIDVKSKLSGGGWEPVKTASKKKADKGAENGDGADAGGKDEE